MRCEDAHALPSSGLELEEAADQGEAGDAGDPERWAMEDEVEEGVAHDAGEAEEKPEG